MRPLFVSLQRPGAVLHLRSRSLGSTTRTVVHAYDATCAVLVVVRPWGFKKTERLSIRLDGSCVERPDLYLPDPS